MASPAPAESDSLSPLRALSRSPLTAAAAQVHGFSEVALDASQKAIVTTINYESRDFDSYNFNGGRVDLIFAMKVRARQPAL